MVARKPCENPDRPLCRFFYDKKCRKGDRCRFYHPLAITPAITKERKREPGTCYCGSYLRTVINKTPIRTRSSSDDSELPLFIVVCGKTGRSMKRCR
jgi:hypothetical protein